MRISLNGSDWLFKDFYGEDWRWRDSHKPGTRDVRWWRQGGRVPGSVLDDLWRLGEIANPYVEQHSLLCEWVPQRTWLYKKSFDVPEAANDFSRARLVFEGVDHEAEFFLNGEPLGTHRGMYTRAEFEVGDKLRYGGDEGAGENLLAVVIPAAPHEEPQVGRTSRVHTHKARMNYWWDFCPRLVHQGIWDDIWLEFSGEMRIADIAVRPRLNDDFSRGQVHVEVTLDSTIESEAEIAIALRYDGATVAETAERANVTPGEATIIAVLPVDNPHLWWPGGYGDQALYECEVTVLGESAMTRFGIRRIELAPNDTPDITARPYTFVVNGRKIYINGWNWVPIDALYGVPRPAKLERLLTLARDAHVNMLRVWGGGLIEKKGFYDLCDELGIMVWQEFILSSSGIDNSPTVDPEYIAMLTAEAEQIIPRRRNHPSLALWCGGNELQGRPGMLSASEVERSDEQPLDDGHPALAALKAAVERLDPGRLWLPTSPTGRAFGNSLENIEADPLGQHDVHGPWEYQGVTKHYTLYNAGTSLLHSEFGVEGITNLKTLNLVLPKEKQWPIDLAQNRAWFHLGAWWVRRVVWDEVFGPLPDVQAYVRATQFIQADGLRYALEADRRRQWRSSGALPWQFNEPYPMAACTSAVDYWAEPKPVYYAVARAYAPLTVTAAFPTIAWEGRKEFEATVWVSSAGTASQESDASGKLTVRLIGASGRVCSDTAHDVTWTASGSTELAGVRHPIADLEKDVFFLDLQLAAFGQSIVTNRYIFTRTTNLASLMAPQPETSLEVEWEASAFAVERHPSTPLHSAQDASQPQTPTHEDGWRVSITNTGSRAALFVWLEDGRERGSRGWAYFEDNYFCLFPGEQRTVTARWRDVPEGERRLEVGGWNTARVSLPAQGDS